MRNGACDLDRCRHGTCQVSRNETNNVSIRHLKYAETLTAH